MVAIIRFFIFFILGIVWVSQSVYAQRSAAGAEHLRYDQLLPLHAQKPVYEFIKTHLQTDSQNTAIAPIDLNRDGLDEFVITQQSCKASENPCRYDVVAVTGRKAVPLLETITARGILIDHQVTTGVRNILLLQNIKNDYSYNVYVWDSAHSRYILSE